MIMKVSGIALAALMPLFVGAPAKADSDVGTTAGAAADAVIAEQLAKYQIPGAAVVIVADGRQVYAKGYGVADTATRAPVDPAGTGFLIGSLAKVLTANAIQQLVTAGKLDLATDVNKYLTTFKVKDTYPGRPVTVGDLVTHTSGFEDTVLGVATPIGVRAEPLGEWLAGHQPARVRPPGTLASYDNYGVSLAGYLVELASGQPYAEYVEQHVLAPLGMTGTRVKPPHQGLATGYRSDGTRAEGGQYGTLSPTGAGVAGIPTDFGRYMLAQLEPGNPVLERRFGHDPRLPGMAMIFEEHPRNGQRVLSKNGDVPGYHDNLALLPGKGVGVYVVYNGDGVNGEATFAGQDLVNRVIDALYPGVPTPARVDDGDLARYDGDYRITRYNHHDFTKFAQLTSAVSVTAESGGITTTGLSEDPNTKTQFWVPIGSGLFVENGGQAQIAFRDGVLLSSVSPTVAYERLAWYQSPVLHLTVAGVALLILLYAFVSGLIWAVAQRRLGRWQLLARIGGWVTAALAVLFVVLLATALSDTATLNERIMLNDSTLLDTSLVSAKVMVLFTALMPVGAAFAWVRGWWTRPGRIGYTATALAALAFLGVGAVYNLV